MYTHHVADPLDEASAALFGMAHSLHILRPSPVSGHLETEIPLWISYARRMESITFSGVDERLGLDGGLEQVAWNALASSLGAAKQLKEVQFIEWRFCDRIPEYVEVLSVLAHPHFSLVIETSEDHANIIL